MNRGTHPIEHAVLATLSPNRTGITAQVTEFLFQHGANVLGSFSVKLGGAYASNVYFRAPAGDMATIEAKFESELAEFSPRFHRTTAPERSASGRNYELSLYTFDREGIVAKTAEILSRNGADIVATAGCSYAAPEVDRPLFVLQMTVDIPDDRTAQRIAAELSATADENVWDVRFEPARDVQGPAPSMPFPPMKAAHLSEVHGLA